MCIPHFSNTTVPARSREKKEPRKSIPFNEALMKPNPDFVDERKFEPKPKKSWLEELLS